MLSALLAAAVLSQTEPPPPPAANEPLIPPAFLDQALTWDAESHQALKGRQKLALTRTEFFTEVGRADLVEKSLSIRNRRIALFATAGGLTVAGVTAGVLVLAQRPDMNAAICVSNIDNYNRCHSRDRLLQGGGIGLIFGSVATSMLLATLAYWSNPEVVDSDEAISLTSKYNASLLRKLRGRETSSLKWMPVVGPDGAQLAVAGKF